MLVKALIQAGRQGVHWTIEENKKSKNVVDVYVVSIIVEDKKFNSIWSFK